MSVICNNLLKAITTEIILRLRNESRIVVWYGGRSVLGVVNDCLNILGGKIDYAIVEEDKLDEPAINYSWTIPLVNKHICVDIRKSSILFQYHIKMNQPKKVTQDIISILGNEAVYVISSKYSEKMIRLLKDKRVSRDNIIVIASEEESITQSHSEMSLKFRGLRLLSLAEIHDAEFSMLCHFKSFCEKNKLRYWLGGGTMLGAIRHNGFIPCDDDIYVFMPDSYYEIFIYIYRDTENYELLHYSKDDNYPHYFSKLSDKRTIIWHYDYPIEYVMGTYIDIFPLVGYPSDKEELDMQWELEHLTIAEWYWYKNMTAILGKENVPVSGESILEKLTLPKFDSSEYVGQVSVIHQKQWVSPKRDFDGFIDRKFESEDFRIPIGYDSHLKERYGDYMTLPPEEKRTVHSFPMYWRTK